MNFGKKAARETGDVKVNSDVNSCNVSHCVFVAHYCGSLNAAFGCFGPQTVYGLYQSPTAVIPQFCHRLCLHTREPGHRLCLHTREPSISCPPFQYETANLPYQAPRIRCSK